ncbi:LacI family DNA-binding transcriptional regulator [Bacillus sp. FJAT-49736]|uniref:LacI family DNA-binding transcriptional regulator n=1 Tax=Bacillus sp. FJAT-49736 TaxID=2833582 RepID=UPI001BC9A8B7|nr:LacI family DNA-binding transcriptional regulator [Bacillus sp. FJAT-49736]MBS4174990.1 LacI family DNA-binding transcriptional regulator [Bacillus sp. FJAT-49736]
MNISIKDIAARTNLSTSTVSRALNSQYGVSKKTREQVLQAAKELGYVPNLFAKELVHSKSNLVGLLIKDSTMGEARPAFFEMLPYINKTLALYGKSTIIASINPYNIEDNEIETIIKTRNLSGIIVFSGLQYRSVLQQIRKSSVPVVIIEEDLLLKQCSCIGTDEFYGAELAVKQLFQLGHREIGFINGPENIGICKKRLAGFRKALERFGLSYNEKRIIHSDFSGYGGGQSALTLMDKNPQLTAIFFANDIMAMGGISLLTEKGWNVPNDISVIGYDGLYMTPYYNPSLATIKIDNQEIGIKTAELLFELINGGKGRSIFIRPTFQNGNSIIKKHHL